MSRPLLLAFTVLWLAGCSAGNTLSRLEGREMPVNAEAAPVASIDETIRAYRSFLAVTPVNHPLYADAAMRLADLEMRNGAAKSLQEREARYIKAYQTMEKAQAPGTEDFRNAIETYEALLEASPDDPRNDWILYQLARAYEQSDQPRRSLDALDRLVRAFPASGYTVEAHFRRGETYFDLQEFDRAAEAYERVVRKGPGTPFYDKALYKQGWAYLKQERYQAGLMPFLQLFEALHLNEEANLDETKVGRGEAELRRDILRGINLCLAYTGGVAALERVLADRRSSDYAPLMYRSLGEYYLEHERIKDAADTFAAFFRRYPDNPRAPFLHARLIEAYEKERLFTTAMSAKADMAESFGPQSDFWEQARGDIRAELAPLMKETLAELARYHHALADKRRSRAARAKAMQWYERYVVGFADDAKTPHMQFLLAEALFAEKQYPKAARAYHAAAYDYGNHPDASQAGYAALTALEKGGDREGRWQSLWIEEALAFAAAFPDDPRRVDVMAKTAERLYALKDYPRALQTADAVINHSEAPQEHRRTALTVAGHAAFEMGDFMRAEASYQQAVALTEGRGKKALEERLAAAIYKQGEARQSEGDLAAAAQRFQQAGTLAPSTDIGATALYDAAASWVKAESWKTAIDNLETLRANFPQHSLADKALEKLALAYEQDGQWAKAAAAYGALADNKAEDREVRRQAAWQAAELYAKAGEAKHAIGAYKNYIHGYPAPLEPAMEARNRLAALYAETKQPEKRRYWLKDMAKQGRAAGDAAGARVLYLAAQAAFGLAEEHDLAFRSAQLTVPLKKTFKRKSRLMEAALDSYAVAAEMGVAGVATAATYRTAEIYRETARALLASQRPRGLGKAELAEYDLMLEEQAYPFEEKAIRIHEANTRRVKDGVYDAWVRGSYDELRKLFPARFAKMERADALFEAIN